MMCATGYVYTGISKKKSPIHGEWRVEWVQCCRVGYGAVVAHAPPIVQTPNGALSSLSSQQRFNDVPSQVPKDYAHQYRGKRSVVEKTAIHTGRHSVLAERELGNEGAEENFAMLKAAEQHRRMEQARGGTLNFKTPLHAL
ncbi:hypothetical protein RvY_04398 [Ramazzottius varieornatus]|uniref:Uncharacterized protein n=1 Tax=Ramazzottius varieornatus TaxID=947166 RepID=A0A1D1UUW1_RAMVA|nr:hypothetical protein RvY_04398 [Ramazzottius varieornatus]